jgi:hypothetical protein
MEVDQRQNVPYPRGRLTISAFDYAEATHSAVRFWEVPCAAHVRVSTILALIQTLGLHHYNMDPNGQGCRFWL